MFLHIFPHSGDFLKNLAQNQYHKVYKDITYRGSILDHHKSPLAISIKKPSIAINPRVFAPSPGELKQLSSYLNMPIEKLKKAKNKTNYFSWIKRKVTNKEQKLVEDMNLKGIYVVFEPSRYYPNSPMASQLIGYVGTDNYGLMGLEETFDSVLSPKETPIYPLKDAKGHPILMEEDNLTPNQSGNNVILTLDRAIQEITEKALEKAYVESKAKAAFAIVLDPHTGRILALANQPSFTPLKPIKDLEVTKNRAFNFYFEPGSVLKPLVISMALEEGLIQEHEIHLCEKSGAYQVLKNKFIHDDHPKEFQTTAEVLINSSNICTYKIAQKLGKEKLYDTYLKFSIGATTKLLNSPLEFYTPLAKPESWNEMRFSNISFGQGLLVNGIQVVRAFSVFANGGYLVSPYVVERVEDYKGNIILSPPMEQKQRVISSTTADIMKRILYRTVEEGTGSKAKMNNYTSAGKTGTAQKADLVTHGYSAEMRIANFVGFAPAFDPHLVIYIVIDEPGKKPYYGGVLAAPVFEEIASQALKYLNVAEDKAGEEIKKNLTDLH